MVRVSSACNLPQAPQLGSAALPRRSPGSGLAAAPETAATPSPTCTSQYGESRTRHASGTAPGDNRSSPCHGTAQHAVTCNDICIQARLGTYSAKLPEHLTQPLSATLVYLRHRLGWQPAGGPASRANHRTRSSYGRPADQLRFPPVASRTADTVVEDGPGPATERDVSRCDPPRAVGAVSHLAAMARLPGPAGAPGCPMWPGP